MISSTPLRGRFETYEQRGNNCRPQCPVKGSRVACGCRQPEFSRTNHRIGVSAFCRNALGREGRFEGYCSEGVEQYKFRARVVVRQSNSREVFFNCLLAAAMRVASDRRVLSDLAITLSVQLGSPLISLRKLKTAGAGTAVGFCPSIRSNCRWEFWAWKRDHTEVIKLKCHSVTKPVD